MSGDEASTAALLAPARAQRLQAFWNGSYATFTLATGGALVIGRSREADVRLDDASVSRQHATIRLDPPITIEDLGSANGTRLDGRLLRPHQPEPLPVGALVEIGVVRLIACARTAAQAQAGDAMARVHDVVRRVAPSDLPVIITGETGVGKEVLAERIHRESHRSQGPLLRINCAALPDSLLESELFGHERGAFTGADQAKPGLLETANGGTVLLDEIGELSATTQAKLLRVLESREVLRVGSRRPSRIDVRFVVATHDELDVLVVLGRFREDLLFRLNRNTNRDPPLRDRPNEIHAQTQELLATACAHAGKPPLAISEAATVLLASYRWPGNVRELRQVLHRAALLCPSGTLGIDHVTFGPAGAGPAQADRPRTPSDAPPSGLMPPAGERERIELALERTGGNQTEAAKLLGISRRTLSSRLDQFAILRPRKGAPKPGP
jgi:two-component system response regulator AtoC